MQLMTGFAAGIAAAGVIYVAVSALVGHRFTRAIRRNPLDNPAFAGAAPDRIRFQARGEPLELAGWFFDTRPRSRAIVLVHGKDACRGTELRSSTHELVDRLRARGFAVLTIDLRGHGESGPARMTYGINERRDVLGAIDWLLARGYEPGRIGVLGASMGGAAAIGAAREEAAIGAIVTDSTYADFNEMIEAKFRDLSGLPRFFLPGGKLLARALTGQAVHAARPLDHARALGERVPMLVIHAQSDPFVPVEHARRLASVSGAQLWVTEGERHLASFVSDREEYARQVAQFFDLSLSPT